MPPVAKVKTESKPKPIAKKVKVEEKTSVGAVNEEDIPLVRLEKKERERYDFLPVHIYVLRPCAR